MSATKAKKNQNSTATKKSAVGASVRDTAGKEADVLYQRIGNQWYSYCVIDEEVFMGKVPEEFFHTDKMKSKK